MGLSHFRFDPPAPMIQGGTRAAVMAVGLGVLCAASGCKPSGPRQEIQGTVTVDSQKVSKGSISFFPARDTVGPTTSTAIVDGHYSFTRENGPHAGKYRVVIGVTSNEPAAGTSDSAISAAEDDSSGMQSAKLGPVPQRRSSRSAQKNHRSRNRWTIEYEIPDEGGGHKDFDLLSDTPPIE